MPPRVDGVFMIIRESTRPRQFRDGVRSTQVGGVAGQGGGADIVECQAGKNGAVKIMKPGFYSEDASLLQARGQV